MSIIKKQFSKRAAAPQSSLSTFSTALTSSNRKKEVTVSSTNRYTIINISNSVQHSNNEIHVRTKVVKDRLLNSTETHIKKVFIHHKKNKSEVILREIITDRFKKTRNTESKSIRVSLNELESIGERIQLFFENTAPPIAISA